jgi:hypothetical protein
MEYPAQAFTDLLPNTSYDPVKAESDCNHSVKLGGEVRTNRGYAINTIKVSSDLKKGNCF